VKSYTDIPTAQNTMAKPEGLNANLEKYLVEWNGNLNGNNMPVYSVQSNDIKIFDTVEATAGGITGFKTDLQTQGLYWRRRSSSFEGGTDVFTNILSIDLKTDDWSKGWNPLAYYSGFEDWNLIFDAREGMLVGCCTIDWQHGCDVLTCNNGGDPLLIFPACRGNDWTSEWGVFVNDVLVARTGAMPPKRHTVSLPFSIPCGSQTVKVDCRWISSISEYASGEANSDGSEFVIFSAEVWVRNAIR